MTATHTTASGDINETSNGLSVATLHTHLLVILMFLTFIALFLNNTYMSVKGLMALYPNASLNALVVGIVFEVGKIGTIDALYIHWNGNSRKYNCFLIVTAAILTAITLWGVFGFWIENHNKSTQIAKQIESKLKSIKRKETLLRDHNDVIHKTLSGLPASYVTRRLDEYKSTGYYNNEAQLDKLEDNKATLELQLISSKVDAGPQLATARFLGLNEQTAAYGLSIVLSVVSEILLIALIIYFRIDKDNKLATIKKLRLLKKRDSDSPIVFDPAKKSESAKSESGQICRKKEKDLIPSRSEAFRSKRSSPKKQPNNDLAALLAIRDQYNLSILQIKEITGKQRSSTVERWINGQSPCPNRAIQLLKKWAKNEKVMAEKSVVTDRVETGVRPMRAPFKKLEKSQILNNARIKA